MKSSSTGNITTTAEVEHITSNGFWLAVGDEHFFLSFNDHYWFKDAPVHAVFHVEFTHGFHLSWPELDIDLDIDCLRHPEKYPLRCDPDWWTALHPKS
jgi:hypothetical protein